MIVNIIIVIRLCDAIMLLVVYCVQLYCIELEERVIEQCILGYLNLWSGGKSNHTITCCLYCYYNNMKTLLVKWGGLQGVNHMSNGACDCFVLCVARTLKLQISVTGCWEYRTHYNIATSWLYNKIRRKITGINKDPVSGRNFHYTKHTHQEGTTAIIRRSTSCAILFIAIDIATKENRNYQQLVLLLLYERDNTHSQWCTHNSPSVADPVSCLMLSHSLQCSSQHTTWRESLLWDIVLSLQPCWEHFYFAASYPASLLKDKGKERSTKHKFRLYALSDTTDHPVVFTSCTTHACKHDCNKLFADRLAVANMYVINVRVTEFMFGYYYAINGSWTLLSLYTPGTAQYDCFRKHAHMTHW